MRFFEPVSVNPLFERQKVGSVYFLCVFVLYFKQIKKPLKLIRGLKVELQ